MLQDQEVKGTTDGDVTCNAPANRVRRHRERQRQAGNRTVQLTVPEDLVPALKLARDILASGNVPLVTRFMRTLLNLRDNHLTAQSTPAPDPEAAKAALDAALAEVRPSCMATKSHRGAR